MLNLIKYELKGYAKELIISLGIIIVLNLLLLTRIKAWSNEGIVSLSCMITFAILIVVFVWNIALFSKDMYKDSGYLLFTLPESGYSILGAKLLTALIQNVIVGLTAILFNFIIFTQVANDWKEILSKVSGYLNPGFVILIIVSAVVYIVYLLTIIYFSISLSRVAIRNRKLGKLSAFAIFVVLSIIIGQLLRITSKIFPETFNVNIVSSKLQNVMVMYQMHGIDINIASLIFEVIILIVLFIITSYILENKIDL
ncbi:membrane protein [Clostridium carboxidivorans P7]|uniref:Uncharacterized protein n=1 Tax=Clostridium carboxidivorans P7 TaxID=536227 RepID=C6Q1N7_9CLOT|nr:hypothetical protein [Clostridium carboxidivorans]AKN30746.1 membrane protein [Clostridium carboxidivorans P7]EET84606.1 conserved hypothetical protein [Clostridium carboxidivorans P7]EFG88551.1 membrane protein, putative [Clostridium carboxidivorans P7]